MKVVFSYICRANISEPMNLGRIQTIEQHGVTLNVSIPADDDAARYFGIELAGFNIQPIWVRIENNSDVDTGCCPMRLIPIITLRMK
ncbi:MAG: hypothetical protein P8Y20_03525 [Gammaproteobacteria bacterium]